MNNSDCVQEFNKLLRGEISATETYRQAIEMVEHPVKNQLREILKDHQKSVASIKKHIVDMGGQPDNHSGTWGVFAKLVEGAATILGTQVAVAALKEGEQIGISDYQATMNLDSLGSECRLLINNELLPLCQMHVNTLTTVASEV